MSPLERAARLLAPESRLRQAVVFAIVSVLCALILADLSQVPRFDWQPGEIATRDVTSPIEFTFVDAAATQDRQFEAEAQVAPVFTADLTVVKRLENRVSQAFDMARRRSAVLDPGAASARNPVETEESEIRADFLEALDLSIDPVDVALVAEAGYPREIEDIVVELIGVAMRRNVVPDRTSLPNPPRPIKVVSTLGDSFDETMLDDYTVIRTPDEARQAVSLHVLERFAGARHPEQVKAAAAIARSAIRTNFAYDPARTEAARAAAREAVGAVEQRVRKGTRLASKGDVLTAHQVRELGALREAGGAGRGWWVLVAWTVVTAVLLGATVTFASTTIRKFAARAREREALGFALVLVLLVGRIVGSSAAFIELPSPYDVGALALLVPVAGGAMLVRILVNSESALVWALVASVLCATMMDRSSLLVGYYLVTSVVATTGVGPARERLVVLRAGVQSGIVGALLIIVISVLRARDPGAEGAFAVPVALAVGGAALLAGIFNAVLALGVIPAFELFGFVTDYKLLELASLNHPLLRQLMLRAPGTYHHSVIVGTLSEAACETIGANALLARVACYFHDIGKGLKPQYFIENQRDTQNRHDRLSPQHSAAVIINHVREGGVLAREHKLPRPIIDNIYMHHGTGLIQYFHTRAKEQAGPGETVDEWAFRYPGPKPDTREAGIIMLADKVEAACRTIREPDEERIRAMIQQITNGVMNDGQLENCPITLKELYQIADTFTTVLLGIHHHRIEYPSTQNISSGKGRFIPVPRSGTITLEIVNPLRPPPAEPPDPTRVADES